MQKRNFSCWTIQVTNSMTSFRLMQVSLSLRPGGHAQPEAIERRAPVTCTVHFNCTQSDAEGSSQCSMQEYAFCCYMAHYAHCKNKIVILTKKTLSVEIQYQNKHYYVKLTQNYVSLNKLLSICVKLTK